MKILFRQKDGYTVSLKGWVVWLIALHLLVIVGLFAKAAMAPPEQWWWIPIVLVPVMALPSWTTALEDEPWWTEEE